MKNIDEILSKNGWIKRNQKMIIDFEIIEKKIDFILPDDYKNFAEEFYGNENSIGNEYVQLWDWETELRESNEGYEIFDNLYNIIAIGGNGGGEFIGIQNCENNKLRIILCPFIDMSEENFIEIGHSFSDFLIRLEKGTDWFE